MPIASMLSGRQTFQEFGVEASSALEINRFQDSRSKVHGRSGSRHYAIADQNELRVYLQYIHCWRLMHGHCAGFSFRK